MPGRQLGMSYLRRELLSNHPWRHGQCYFSLWLLRIRIVHPQDGLQDSITGAVESQGHR